MVFSSTIFLFVFLPLVWLINRFLPRQLSNYFLCLASLLFYAWGEPIYVVLLILLALANFLLARWMDDARHKKPGLVCGIVCGIVLNIATLLVFKYADFAVATLNRLPGVNMALPGILLPIGVSFFIFQAMSYLIDVYRGEAAVQKSFVKLLLYVSFFPQLIAGPIIYYHDIAAQIEERKITSTATAQGIRRFIIGLAKKILIADTLAVAVDTIFALEFADVTMPLSWIAAASFMLQLYFDFSGYSDMALGLARMFGFEYKENFNYPYIAGSIQDFWHRWHISLSTWFRDYVYIPLGGNRKGNGRTALNKIIVFCLTGLWHGAQWTFVVWGLIHGAFLLLEQYLRPYIRLPKKLRVLAHIYTLLVVLFAFVLFRAESFGQALVFIQNMLAGSMGLGIEARLITPLFITAFVAAIVGSLPWLPALKHRLRGQAAEKFFSPASYMLSLVLLLLCMLSLSADTYNAFIYFRF